MTAESDPIKRLIPTVICFCGRTFTVKGTLIAHLESHGVIRLAQELARILINPE